MASRIPNATLQSAPLYGSLVLNADGGFTYTPFPNFFGTDQFFYRASNGIPPDAIARVDITVQPVDDAPVAVNDSATTAENAAPMTIDVLANDSDIDGGPKFIASVSQPAHGTVVIVPGGLSLTYQPDAGYCNGGNPLDTFTYTLNGGSTATVSVTVTCEIPPIAVDDSATVIEDSGANPVNVLTNDTDVDGGPKIISSVAQPANGTVVITGGGTGLTYQPNPNYCNTPPGTTLDISPTR